MELCTVVAASTVAPVFNATLVVSIAVAVIGLATFVVGYSQMKIASAKIKLDLYNRRFAVYLATLEYYQSAYGKTEESMEVKGNGFIKAYRESQFLFDADDGIYKTLTRIKDSGADIKAYQAAQAVEMGLADEKTARLYDKADMHRLHEKNVVGHHNFYNDLNLLESKLLKYLQFKTVSGWTLSRKVFGLKSIGSNVEKDSK